MITLKFEDGIANKDVATVLRSLAKVIECYDTHDAFNEGIAEEINKDKP
jgi:hypothetical protein